MKMVISTRTNVLQVIDRLLQAPLDRLKEAVRMLCVVLLRLTADAEAVSVQRKQVRSPAKLWTSIPLELEVSVCLIVVVFSPTQ